MTFESNSRTPVASLTTSHRETSEFSIVVSHIIYELVLHSIFEMKFIRRQMNMVAHTLIRVACFWASHHVFEISPTCFEQLLINYII